MQNQLLLRSNYYLLLLPPLAFIDYGQTEGSHVGSLTAALCNVTSFKGLEKKREEKMTMFVCLLACTSVRRSFGQL